MNALPSHQVNIFLGLISVEWRNFLLLSDPESQKTSEMGLVDWDRFVELFELWAKTLLQVFATRNRPVRIRVTFSLQAHVLIMSFFSVFFVACVNLR